MHAKTIRGFFCSPPSHCSALPSPEVLITLFSPRSLPHAIVSLCELGDRAMWIVMYVAIIASLSAMGMVPGAETGDPLPHDEA